MSQQWEYRTVMLETSSEDKVNAALATWAANGWELVNGSYGVTGSGYPLVWLFWRRAK